MNKQQPMLMESPLTKRVFVVTSYVDNGDGTYTARQKYDVTEQFDALAAKRRGECEDVGTAAIFKCSMCGWQSNVFTFGEGMPCFCPRCGKVVKR